MIAARLTLYRTFGANVRDTAQRGHLLISPVHRGVFRSAFAYQNKDLIADAEEIRQAISVEGKQISRNEITSHIRILEKYNFACFEEIDDQETGKIMLGDEAFVLSTARRIAEDGHPVISDGFLSTLETILVRLDFSSFENASREQSTSGKEGQSRKKRRAKSSRHTK